MLIVECTPRYLIERGADTSLRGRCTEYEDKAVDLCKPLKGTPLDYAKQVERADIFLMAYSM